jgi:hypothetical protein
VSYVLGDAQVAVRPRTATQGSNGSPMGGGEPGTVFESTHFGQLEVQTSDTELRVVQSETGTVLFSETRSATPRERLEIFEDPEGRIFLTEIAGVWVTRTQIYGPVPSNGADPR